jgi:hypothetical protein
MSEPERCWHYALGAQQVGPVTWPELRGLARNGGLNRQTLIWKIGMEHWVAAGRVAGLFEDVPILARPVAYAHRTPLDEDVCLKARRYALAMFAALVTGLVTAAVFAVEHLTPARRLSLPMPLALVAKAGVLAIFGMGVFSAAYLPYRWRIIRQLDANHRLLTLIGGFGLIVLLLAQSIVMWVV